jgi:hypothetical protein
MIKDAMYAILPQFHARLSELFENKPFERGMVLQPFAKVFEQVEL